MTEFVKTFQDQVAVVARWTAKLDARDALVPAIQAVLPSGTLEVIYNRTASYPGDPSDMANRINDDRSLWQANIRGSNPSEIIGVEDVRDLADELGVPVPALVRK